MHLHYFITLVVNWCDSGAFQRLTRSPQLGGCLAGGGAGSQTIHLYKTDSMVVLGIMFKSNQSSRTICISIQHNPKDQSNLRFLLNPIKSLNLPCKPLNIPLQLQLLRWRDYILQLINGTHNVCSPYKADTNPWGRTIMDWIKWRQNGGDDTSEIMGFWEFRITRRWLGHRCCWWRSIDKYTFNWIIAVTDGGLPTHFNGTTSEIAV